MESCHGWEDVRGYAIRQIAPCQKRLFSLAAEDPLLAGFVAASLPGGCG
jgi:hypothetical protein